MRQKILALHRVSKSYPVYSSGAERLKELAGFARFTSRRHFTALSDVTFDVTGGETVCIVGENGSGKSTLLQIVAGILTPTSGNVEVRGRVAALLELGAGFNADFTGRENVFLNAAIHGFSRREMEHRFPAIADFADLGEFMERPVRTWSSGMVVRLAFAVAIHVDPEILLVDEALAVGDAGFRQRCMRRINELRQGGATIIFVSHSMADVEAIGDRAIWLEHGRVREIGEPAQIVAHYMAETDRTSAGSAAADGSVDTLPNIDRRSGDRRAELVGIALLDAAGRRRPLLIPGQRMSVRITARAHRRLEHPVVGFLVRDHLGMEFTGTDTRLEHAALPPMSEGESIAIEFRMQVPELYPAPFSFSPFVRDGDSVCDQVDNAITVEVSRGEKEIYGRIHLPCRIEVDRALPGWSPQAVRSPETYVG